MAFKIIYDDEVAAELCGLNVKKYKVIASLIASSLIGLTGALCAHFNVYIVVTLFHLSAFDILVLVMLVFGGMRTALGPVIGSAVFTLVNELIKPLGALTIIVYGITLILLFALFREGLVPYLSKRLSITII